jgi:four helix bundle protein
MLAHEKLDVYRCAIDFLALCVRVLDFLPRGNSALADQLKRASLSIPLNIAEGAGKPGKADRRRFYGIARGSAMECGAILDACRVLKLVDEELTEEAKVLLVRIVSMLSKM